MKTAKGILIVLLATFMCLWLAGTGVAAGGNGGGQGNGNGRNQSMGRGGEHVADLLSAEVVEISGTVSEVDGFGKGISIDTGGGVFVDVYGIGPLGYWDELGMSRPDVGEEITVTGREITFSDGTTKIIAFGVLFLESGEYIELRDEETGLPLWRGEGAERRHRQRECCPCTEEDDIES